MPRWAELLTTIGSGVAFDYPYLTEGRKRPARCRSLSRRIAPRLKRRGSRTPDRLC